MKIRHMKGPRYATVKVDKALLDASRVFLEKGANVHVPNRSAQVNSILAIFVSTCRQAAADKASKEERTSSEPVLRPRPDGRARRQRRR